MAPRFGRPSPYPGSRPVVELDGCHLHGSFNLIGIGKTLASEGIASKEAPPAFLEIEPACTLGNEVCWRRGWFASQMRVSRLL